MKFAALGEIKQGQLPLVERSATWAIFLLRRNQLKQCMELGRREFFDLPVSQLSADTTLEDKCILLPNSFFGHDSVLENYVSIANNACIWANVRVGFGTHVGANASTREKNRHW